MALAYRCQSMTFEWTRPPITALQLSAGFSSIMSGRRLIIDWDGGGFFVLGRRTFSTPRWYWTHCGPLVPYSPRHSQLESILVQGSFDTVSKTYGTGTLGPIAAREYSNMGWWSGRVGPIGKGSFDVMGIVYGFFMCTEMIGACGNMIFIILFFRSMDGHDSELVTLMDDIDRSFRRLDLTRWAMGPPI